jgi:hypothetical protein
MSTYVDTLLATLPIVSEGESYGECLTNCFKELVRRELRAVSAAWISESLA